MTPSKTKKLQIVITAGAIVFLLIVASVLVKTRNNRQTFLSKASTALQQKCDLNNNNSCFEEDEMSKLNSAIDAFRVKCTSAAPADEQTCTRLIDVFDMNSDSKVDKQDILTCTTACTLPTKVPVSVTVTPKPTIVCRKGLKDVIVDQKSCMEGDTSSGQDSSTTNTASQGPIDTNTQPNVTVAQKPTEKPRLIKLMGFLCWNDNGDGTYSDDEFMKNEMGCMTDDAVNERLMEKGADGKSLIERAEDFCTGKESPLCRVTPTQSIPTPSPVPTVKKCEEGVKDYNIKRLTCESTQTPDNDNNSPSTQGQTQSAPPNVFVTQSPESNPDVQFKGGYSCWDGTTKNVDTGCVRDKDADSVERNIITAAQNFCKGKKAPSCSITPSPTIVDGEKKCAFKTKGDANCDGVIDLKDFAEWLSEYIGTSKTINADFNGDGKVTLIDFDVWRVTFTGVVLRK